MRRVACALVAALFVAGCGGDDEPAETASRPFVAPDPGPLHVHGLGVNPADGALFIATHTGLFRVASDDDVAQRVAGRYQDTMGFTVIGPDRFLGSGHPDLRERKPPYLGLIASGDAGNTWKPVSLYGKADFHVLESAGERVVGYGSDFASRRQQLLVSDDAGKTWAARNPPGPLIDLALSPADADVWVASTARAVFRTVDSGRSWKPLRGSGGLLAWRAPKELVRAGDDGQIGVSSDGGSTWRRVGDLGGQPAALEGEDDSIYAALHDGVIKRSRDGGRTWAVRSRPEPVDR